MDTPRGVLPCWAAGDDAAGAPKIPGRKKLKRERGPVLVIANHRDLSRRSVRAGGRCPFTSTSAGGGDGRRPAAHDEESAEVAELFLAMGKSSWVFLVSGGVQRFSAAAADGGRESFRYAVNVSIADAAFWSFLKAGARPMDSCSRSGRAIGMLAKSLNVPVVAMRIKGLWE